MADIYIMAQNNTSGHVTGHDLAEQVRKRTGREIEKVRDALRKKLGRLSEKHPDIFPDASWSLDRTFTPDQSKMLAGRVSARRPAKKSQTVLTPSAKDQPGTTPAPSRLKLPTFTINDFLALAIYGHTALVWYEVASIFALPGFLAGVVLFAMKHTATTLVKDEKRNAIHGDVLGVAFVLDALAVFPHYTVFVEALPDRYAQQMGTEGTFWAALVLAIVVAAGAFLSMYFIKAITDSKIFD